MIKRSAMAKVLYSIMIFTLMAGYITFKTHEVVSAWHNRQILVDGKADEWKGAQFFLEEEQLLLGFLNDQDFLYLSLIAESPSNLPRIMMGGLTVCIDPKRGKKKAMESGIRLELVWKEHPWSKVWTA